MHANLQRTTHELPILRRLLAGMSILTLALGWSAAPAQTPPLRIISLGDSYASGEGAPDPTTSHPIWRGDNTDSRASACHRSTRAAPAIAAGIIAGQRPVIFTHLACSGAKVSQLLGGGGQLAVAAAVAGRPIDDLVISIGGNDIGFASAVTMCLLNIPVPCDPTIPAFLASGAPALVGALNTLVASIRAMPVPVRNVFLTEYPDPSTTLLPPPGARCGDPGAPNIPAFGFDTLLPPKPLLAATTIVAPLNAILLATVNRANATSGAGGPVFHFVTGISNAFAGHGYCMGSPNFLAPQLLIRGRMINTPVDSLVGQGDQNGTMHPNSDGQIASGQVIAAAILASAPPPVVAPAKPATTPAPTSQGPSPAVCAKKPWTPGCGN